MGGAEVLKTLRETKKKWLPQNMTAQLPYDCRCQILAYMPLATLQALESTYSFSIDTLKRLLLLRYDLSNDMTTTYVQRANNDKIHTPFDWFIKMAMSAGDLGINGHLYFDSSLCLLRAIERNSFTLFKYYASKAYTLMSHYDLLLQLACEVRNKDIVIYLVAYFCAIHNIARINNCVEDIHKFIFDVYSYRLWYKDYEVNGLRTMNPKMMSTPEDLQDVQDVHNFTTRNYERLRLFCITPQTIRNVSEIRQMLIPLAASRNRDRYLAFCDLLLNSSTCDITLFVDSNGDTISAIYDIAESIGSPLLSKMKRRPHVGTFKTVSTVYYADNGRIRSQHVHSLWLQHRAGELINMVTDVERYYRFITDESVYQKPLTTGVYFLTIDNIELLDKLKTLIPDHEEIAKYTRLSKYTGKCEALTLSHDVGNDDSVDDVDARFTKNYQLLLNGRPST